MLENHVKSSWRSDRIKDVPVLETLAAGAVAGRLREVTQ